MKFKPQRMRLTGFEKGEEALKIDLTGMKPDIKAKVQAEFQRLHREGQLDLPKAFAIINKYEGTPEMKEWKRIREDYETWKQVVQREEPHHAREFYDLDCYHPPSPEAPIKLW